MADAARQTGDPGWIHLNRFNRKNPVPKIGSYKAVAPCGEVAMLEGEACLFGYLNLGNCVKNNDVDYEKIRWITQLAIRFLDDALEQSIENYQNRTSAEIMEQNRKIGLGVCGWQDLLVQLQIPYGSTESLSLAQDIMSFVNFFSKQASVELSAIRGSFPNFVHSEYQHNHITQLFGNSDTKSIQKKDWCLLESSLLTKGIRHCSTTALPPTGRSSLIIGTSPQIEPYFYLNPGNKSNENFILYKEIQNYCSKQSMPKEKIEAMISKIKSKGSVQDIIPTPFSKIFRKATEISVQEHLNTVAAFQIYTDQGISKTINLLKNSSIEEIIDIYLLAYDLGLLGNTIYVDGSKAGQPQKL
jgi:ribonucleoside-diphosphate reductase alpha chain